MEAGSRRVRGLSARALQQSRPPAQSTGSILGRMGVVAHGTRDLPGSGTNHALTLAVGLPTTEPLLSFFDIVFAFSYLC